eukprot:jgi/Tetstr1/449032/TSEL_003800.t1
MATSPAEWCGAASGPALQHLTLSPCWFETAAGTVLLLLGCITVYAESRRLAVLRRAGVSAREVWAGWDEAALLWTPLLAAVHAGWLTWLVTEADAAPVSLFYEAAATATFAALAVMSVVARVQWCRANQHGIMWIALLVYAVTAYSDLGMHYMHWGWTNEAPLVRGCLAVGQFVIAAATLMHHALSGPSEEEEEVLRESLLSSVAVDIGGEGAERKKAQSWLKLCVLALAYVWPDTIGLKARTLVCVVLIVLMRGLNLMVPVLYANTINQLSKIDQQTHSEGGSVVPFAAAFFPWCFYWLVFYVIQGGTGGGSVGLIQNLRSYLWIPVTQRAYKRISVDLFTKMLDLDLSFHLKRKTGEVMRVMDRGTSAIQNLLSIVVFSIGPQMFDIVFASIFIAWKLTPWVSVVVFVTLASYIPLTVVLTEWRGHFRRDMNTKDNAKGAKATDALLNYETVKYFTNEELERRNFGTAIEEYQEVEYKLLASLNALNVVQSLVICTGLVCGMIVCVKGVAAGELTVGDVVLFVTMLNQLYAPLNFFGTYYRTIQQYMIDMENMFELLRSNSGIKDEPDAKALTVSTGTVEFHGVGFEYIPGTPVLRNLNFKAEGGKTLALVGETGSGKSTILRLIFRFYNPLTGCITIDGMDIASLTQHSLRRAIGVVPQDTVLFNDTIGYNISYGNPEESEDAMHRAAMAAKIHGPITERFPQGYETVVGERGLRLSGGEKQRVAVARTLLKNPPILLLDEATSALDTITEKAIQAQLSQMREGRTTIIIAHRLSTIMDADTIVVMHQGEIKEVGSHAALLERGGVYSDMWSRQAESTASGSRASLAALTGE